MIMMRKILTKALRRIIPVKPCGAVIVAAGSATRMGGIDKVLAPLQGEYMIMHTIRAFQKSPLIKEIVVVTRADQVRDVTDMCRELNKVVAVVKGGENRQDSVEAGLQFLSSRLRLVAVHDGARPLVSQELIDRTVRAGHSYCAAAPGVPVKDTIKVVTGGIVKETPDRSKLFAIQTPQVFDRDLLIAALHKARKDNAAVTDDCSAVERLGMSVKIVEGDERNLKITTPMDLKVAELLMEDM